MHRFPTGFSDCNDELSTSVPRLLCQLASAFGRPYTDVPGKLGGPGCRPLHPPRTRTCICTPRLAMQPTYSNRKKNHIFFIHFFRANCNRSRRRLADSAFEPARIVQARPPTMCCRFGPSLPTTFLRRTAYAGSSSLRDRASRQLAPGPMWEPRSLPRPKSAGRYPDASSFSHTSTVLLDAHSHGAQVPA